MKEQKSVKKIANAWNNRDIDSNSIARPITLLPAKQQGEMTTMTTWMGSPICGELARRQLSPPNITAVVKIVTKPQTPLLAWTATVVLTINKNSTPTAPNASTRHRRASRSYRSSAARDCVFIPRPPIGRPQTLRQ
jgi:hypothetical protein